MFYLVHFTHNSFKEGNLKKTFFLKVLVYFKLWIFNWCENVLFTIVIYFYSFIRCHLANRRYHLNVQSIFVCTIPVLATENPRILSSFISCPASFFYTFLLIIFYILNSENVTVKVTYYIIKSTCIVKLDTPIPVTSSKRRWLLY